MAQHRLAFHADDDLLPSISPFQELGAYEVLWAERGASVARLAARFEENLDTLPSDLVPHDEAVEMARTVSRMLKEAESSSGASVSTGLASTRSSCATPSTRWSCCTTPARGSWWSPAASP